MKFALLQLRRVLNNKIASEFPTGTGYLAAYLEKYLPEVETVLEVDPEKILQFKPDIIGISSVSATFNQALAFSQKVKKELGIPVIIGGHHISSLPHSLPDTVDAGVIGEGEETLKELLQTYLKKELDADSLKSIKGIIYRSENRLQINPSRPYIQDLDSIPPPKTDVRLKQEQNLEPALITSRGCPYDCSFCYTGEFWRKVRYHSIDRVVTDITDIIRSNPGQKTIRIYDDIFAIHKERLKSIVEAIRSEGFHKKVNFTCFARASIFDDEICKLLVDMNMKFVDFGFESGSQNILKYLKGHARVAQNQKAVEICERHGLSIRGAFIIGSPPETIEETADTYWFVRRNRNRINAFTMCAATPLPGTGLWDDCVKRNIIREDNIDWDYMHADFVPGKTLHINPNYSQGDLQNFIDIFYSIRLQEEFYKNPVREDYLKRVYFSLFKLMKIFSVSEACDISKVPERIKEQLDIPDGIILSNSKKALLAVHNLDKEKDIKAFIRAFSKKLDKNGYLFLSFYNAGHISLLADLCSGEWLSDRTHIYNKTRFHYLQPGYVISLMKAEGFEIKHLEPVQVRVKELEAFQKAFTEIMKKQGFETSEFMNFSYLAVFRKTRY